MRGKLWPEGHHLKGTKVMIANMFSIPEKSKQHQQIKMKKLMVLGFFSNVWLE